MTTFRRGENSLPSLFVSSLRQVFPIAAALLRPDPGCSLPFLNRMAMHMGHWQYNGFEIECRSSYAAIRRRFSINSIKLLSEPLIRQIAPGEVLERPASALTEVIENSVDGGATDISVRMFQGGTRLIRIVDSGAGVRKD